MVWHWLVCIPPRTTRPHKMRNNLNIFEHSHSIQLPHSSTEQEGMNMTTDDKQMCFTRVSTYTREMKQVFWDMHNTNMISILPELCAPKIPAGQLHCIRQMGENSRKIRLTTGQRANLGRIVVNSDFLGIKRPIRTLVTNAFGVAVAEEFRNFPKITESSALIPCTCNPTATIYYFPNCIDAIKNSYKYLAINIL